MRPRIHISLGLALLVLSGCPDSPSSEPAEQPSNHEETTATTEPTTGEDGVVKVPEGSTGPREVEAPNQPSVENPSNRSRGGSVLMLPSRPPSDFRLNVGRLEPPKLKPLNIGGAGNSGPEDDRDGSDVD